jgi:ketosteroid isomerase-like protein
MSQLLHLDIPSQVFARGELVTQEGYCLTVEDRLNIMQLPAEAEWAIGAQNIDAIAAYYTNDIIIDHPLGSAKGKEAALTLARSGKIPVTGLRHQFSNQVVFIDKNGHPACISYMSVMQIASESPSSVSLPTIFGHLILVDVVQKVNGKWCFAQRIFDQLKVADHLGLDEATRQQIAQTQAERAASNNVPA